MTPLSVVVWKWKSPRPYHSQFGPQTVNVMAKMVARHYPHPHRFVCVTDDARGIDPSIEIVPLWTDALHVPEPHGLQYPSCYVRLKAFSPEARQWFGDRFVSVDLDAVITGDLTALWSRPEEFVIWDNGKDRNSRARTHSYYNGSMWLMTTGTRPKVWETFDPRTSPVRTKQAGFFGSDQAVMSHILGPGEATWTRQDGVYSFNLHLQDGAHPLPADARVVFFHGRLDPWSPQCQRLDWVREHWQ